MIEQTLAFREFLFIISIATLMSVLATWWILQPLIKWCRKLEDRLDVLDAIDATEGKDE